MPRQLLCISLLVLLVTPVLAEEVPISHPQIKDGAKGLYVDGKAYVPIESVNQLFPGTFAWDPAKRVITKPSSATERERPILFVGDEDSCALLALRKAGLRIEQSSRLPDQFGAYTAIIVVNAEACDPKRVSQIEKYLLKGGGLVLSGACPQTFSPNPEMFTAYNLSSIAKWFGSTEIYKGEVRGEVLRTGARAATSRPFGTRIGKGDSVWSGSGDDKIICVPRQLLSERAEPILLITEGSTGPAASAAGAPQLCVAFSHPYGPGRVYWQSMTEEPNFGKLMELFVGGVKWAAGYP